MNFSGRCYCGDIAYQAEGEPLTRVQCHCRECQYLTGGSPNLVIAMPGAGFKFTRGQPAEFTRPDLDTPVTREFCAKCGTHLLTKSPRLPGVMLVKVGTMDEPAQFGEPAMAIYTKDSQPFHRIPEGVPAFEGAPTRR